MSETIIGMARVIAAQADEIRDVREQLKASQELTERLTLENKRKREYVNRVAIQFSQFVKSCGLPLPADVERTSGLLEDLVSRL